MKIFSELRRRNVYKVATVYAITAWLITQILSIATDAFGAPEWVMKMLIIILMVGFPVAVILAWAFELTPEGIRRTSTAAPHVKKKSRKRINVWIVGLLIFALIFLGIERIFFAESTVFADNSGDEVEASIAVLPFEDFSPEGDQQFFADGISEELMNVLATVEGLQVAGRTSSFQFRGETRDLKKIGDSLGVKHILEGSVRKAGNQLRITAKLITSDSGFEVWAETYERPYSVEGIFAIQDDISERVLEELRVQLLPEEEHERNRKPTGNAEAYNLYLKGLSVSQSFNPADISEAIKLYDDAIELDPDFALAYAKKAQALVWLNIYGNLAHKDMLEQSGMAADWALFLDRDLAETYSAMGMKKLMDDKFDQGIAALKLATSLKPGDAEIRSELGVAYMVSGELDKARAEHEYAFKLDPASPYVNLNFGWFYMSQNQPAKAEKHFINAVDTEPDLLAAYDGLAFVHIAQGRLDRAFIDTHRSATRIKQKNAATLENLYRIASDLQLDQFVHHYFAQLNQEFPNNSWSFIAKTDKWMQEEKPDLVLEKTRNYEASTDGLSDQKYVEIMAPALLMKKDYPAVIDLVEEKYPVALKSDTVAIGKRNFAAVFYAAVALRNSGKEESANRMIKNACDFLKEQKKKGKFDTNEVYKWDLAACSGLLGNKAEVYAFLEERIESGFVTGHEYVYGIFNDYFMKLSEEELEPFRRREKEILARQRMNVIAYLKGQGDWEQDWEEESKTFLD